MTNPTKLTIHATDKTVELYGPRILFDTTIMQLDGMNGDRKSIVVRGYSNLWDAILERDIETHRLTIDPPAQYTIQTGERPVRD